MTAPTRRALAGLAPYALALGCMLSLAGCGDDSGAKPEPEPPLLGCRGLGVKIGQSPTIVDPERLAAEITSAVPSVSCGRNRISGAILCPPTNQDCGLRSEEEAEALRVQVAKFLAQHADAAAVDYVVSVDCVCFAD